MTTVVWFHRPDAAALNRLHEGCAVSNLGIEITAIGDNYLCGRMPVDARTKQPFGLMHGGAAVLLLETLASAALRISPLSGDDSELRKLADRLRRLPMPVIGRLHKGALWLDLRCLEAEQEAEFTSQLAELRA